MSSVTLDYTLCKINQINLETDIPHFIFGNQVPTNVNDQSLPIDQLHRFHLEEYDIDIQSSVSDVIILFCSGRKIYKEIELQSLDIRTLSLP